MTILLSSWFLIVLQYIYLIMKVKKLEREKMLGKKLSHGDKYNENGMSRLSLGAHCKTWAF